MVAENFTNTRYNCILIITSLPLRMRIPYTWHSPSTKKRKKLQFRGEENSVSLQDHFPSTPLMGKEGPAPTITVSDTRLLCRNTLCRGMLIV